jgi:transcriptional regulator with XRE-family HTH domain
VTAMRAARLLLGLSLQSVGDAVNAKRAWISTLETYPSRLPSPSLRRKLCAFYGVKSYTTLTREIETAKLGRALLANLEPKKETNAK